MDTTTPDTTTTLVGFPSPRWLPTEENQPRVKTFSCTFQKKRIQEQDQYKRKSEKKKKIRRFIMSFKLKKKGPPMNLSLNLDSDVIADNIPVQVVPGLFVGSIHCSFNEVGMRNAGVTHIINTSGTPATYPSTFTYLSISIRDKDYSNLLSCIPACNIFIEAGLESGGSVLVHCTGGRSRSAAIVTAYLMSSKEILFNKAFHIVKTARSLAACNAGFEAQLHAYGEMKFDVHRAHQLLLRQHMERVAEGRRSQETSVRSLATRTLTNPLRIKLMVREKNILSILFCSDINFASFLTVYRVPLTS